MTHVCNEVTTENDRQIRPLLTDLLCAAELVPAGAEEDPVLAPELPRPFRRLSAFDVFGSRYPRLDHVDVGEGRELIPELGDKVGELRLGVRHFHAFDDGNVRLRATIRTTNGRVGLTSIRRVWRQPQADPLLSYCLGTGLGYLETEPAPVLH